MDDAETHPRIANNWLVLGLVSFLSSIAAADAAGINVALPAIIKEFNGSTAMMVWAINAYLVVFAASVIAHGRLADIYGRRRTFIAGALLFIASLVLSGLSTNPVLFICARALCGLGSAIVVVVSLSIASSSFPRQERGTAIAVWVAFGSVATALGPIIGGLFTELLSWRWFFWIDGAAAALSLIVICFVLGESKDESVVKVDVPGLLLLTAALVLLVVGFQLAEQFGWGSPWVGGGIAGGLAVLVIFYKVEKRVAAPLIDFSLFVGRMNFLGACIAMFLSRFADSALPLFLALYLQHVLGLSAIETGLVFLAMMVPTALTSYIVERVMVPLGPRLLIAASMSFAALGFVSIGFARPNLGFGMMLFGLALFGIGQGLSYQVASTVAMSSTPDEKSGAASGILQSVGCLALSLGVAVTGALFKTTENARLERLFELAGSRLGPEARSEIKGMLSGSDAARDRLAELLPAVAERVDLVVNEAYSHAFRDVMFLFIAISAIGFIFAFAVGHPDHPDVAHANDGDTPGENPGPGPTQP